MGRHGLGSTSAIEWHLGDMGPAEVTWTGGETHLWSAWDGHGVGQPTDGLLQVLLWGQRRVLFPSFEGTEWAFLPARPRLPPENAAASPTWCFYWVPVFSFVSLWGFHCSWHWPVDSRLCISVCTYFISFLSLAMSIGISWLHISETQFGIREWPKERLGNSPQYRSSSL